MFQNCLVHELSHHEPLLEDWVRGQWQIVYLELIFPFVSFFFFYLAALLDLLDQAVEEELEQMADLLLVVSIFFASIDETAHDVDILRLHQA